MKLSMSYAECRSFYCYAERRGEKTSTLLNKE